MRQKCRIRFFSMSDYSTYFEQKKKNNFEKKRFLWFVLHFLAPPASRKYDVITFYGGGVWGRTILKKFSHQNVPWYILHKVAKFHVKEIKKMAVGKPKVRP